MLLSECLLLLFSMAEKLYLPYRSRRALENIGVVDEQKSEFECGVCTKCCETYGSPILVTLPDIYRLSKHLGITMNDFFEQYLQIGGASIASWYMFKPYPNNCAPLSIEMDMPCTLLHENYRDDRGKNCTVYEVAFATCKLPPFLFYDPEMLRNDGKGVAVESISEYQCTSNRFVSIDDVLKAKAFNDLFHREFDFTLGTLYYPRMTFTPEQAIRFQNTVKGKKDTDWYKQEAEKIRGRIRFKIAAYDMNIVIFMSLVRQEMHNEFKGEVSGRLEGLALDNSIVDKLAEFSDEYLQIFNGVIPSHITINRISLTFWPRKRKRGKIRR